MAPPDRLESRTEARGSVRDGSPTPSADTQKGECIESTLKQRYHEKH